MICWNCYWGWPKPVADIYRKYEKLAGNEALEYGRGHVVWADENFDDESVQFCLDSDPCEHWDKDLDQFIIESLKELLLVPEVYRLDPEGYEEDSRPEDFPPPAEWEMVKL